MVRALEKAFAEAAKLPEEEQQRFAAFLLSELESEQRWTESFERSQDKLAAMGRAALEEFRRGETKPFEADTDLSHE